MRAALLVASLVVLWSSPALAQEADETSGTEAEARSLFQAAQVAFDEGRYENALEYFTRSYELSGHAELLFNIGTTLDRLQREADAIERFEQYLEEQPDAENRGVVESRLQALRRARDEQASRDAELAALREERAATEPGQAADGGGPGIGPWVLLVGGAAVAVAGGVLVGIALADKSTVENVEDGTYWDEIESAHSRVEPLSIAGIACLSVGLAAATAGLVWLIAGSDDESAELAVGLGHVEVRGHF